MQPFCVNALTSPRRRRRGETFCRTNEVEITDRAQGHGTARRQFVIDVKTVEMVDGNGV